MVTRSWLLKEHKNSADANDQRLLKAIRQMGKERTRLIKEIPDILEYFEIVNETGVDNLPKNILEVCKRLGVEVDMDCISNLFKKAEQVEKMQHHPVYLGALLTLQTLLSKLLAISCELLKAIEQQKFTQRFFTHDIGTRDIETLLPAPIKVRPAIQPNAPAL